MCHIHQEFNVDQWLNATIAVVQLFALVIGWLPITFDADLQSILNFLGGSGPKFISLPGKSIQDKVQANPSRQIFLGLILSGQNSPM